MWPRTFRTALANAQPGDLIVVKPGTYAGGLVIVKQATAEKPIVIRGEIPASELAKPIQDRKGLPEVLGDTDEAGITVTGSHIVVENLNIRDNMGGGVKLEEARGCVVRGCQVYDNGDYANILITKGGAAAGFNLIMENHHQDRSTVCHR